jgi:hypothetical protein
MAIHKDFRVTDDEGEIASVSGYREENTVTLTQDGNEISVSPEMAKELMQAMGELLE